ncbi:MAG: hypothetical protein ACI4PO_05520 [Faecousia sp.]
MEQFLECIMLTAFDYALLGLLLHDRERKQRPASLHLCLAGSMSVGFLLGLIGKLTVAPVEATAAFYLLSLTLSVIVLCNLVVLKFKRCAEK